MQALKDYRDGFGSIIVPGLIAMGLIATLALVVGISATAQARANHSSGPVVKVRIATSSQAALARGRARVKVTAVRPRSRRKQRVSLALRLRVGRRTVKAAGQARARLTRGRSRIVTVKLSRPARKLVRNCGATSLAVVAKTVVRRPRRRAGWSRSGRSSRSLRQDRSRCGPKVVPVPATVDLDTADRCDFITEGSGPRTECLFPYPNDYFTRTDASTDTGLRLNLNEESTPANFSDVHIDPTALNQSDGFSPGAPMITQIPGMDNIQAFNQSGIVGITQKSRYADAGQPVVLIDAATGDRVPIWAELDANASSPEQTTLEIHYSRNLTDGHRYIVAMRNLKRADGSTVEAPDGFRLYRSPNQVTRNTVIEARRPHFESIFRSLAAAGIPRGNLYMAWDFTVASTENITGRMLHIRNDAFHQLGDDNLSDGIQQGHAPAFSINPNGVPGTRDGIIDYPLSPVPPGGDGVQNIRTITGTFQVPCYLDVAGVPDPAPGNSDGYPSGCPSGAKFKLDPDGMPIRTPGQMMTARFTCNVPRSSVQDDGSGGLEVTTPARPSLYGHGLFGSYREGNSTNIRQLGTEHNVMVCATDWSGMAEDDVSPTAIMALQDMSKFTPVPDRLQQGFLNFLYLGRLMKTTEAQGGFAGNAAFQDDHGDPVIDSSQLYYYGNSQGGIAGGALTAIAPDFTRSVLYVPGMRYSVLLPRSVDFDDFALILYPSYPVERTRPLLLSMIQSLWDRGEPNGYANHMTDSPLPDTPAHKVLIEMAYGDHQVANITAEAEARTIGAPLRRPAVDADRIQPGLIEPWYDLGTLGDLGGPAADGSGAFVWDIGPMRVESGTLYGTAPAPLTNTAPGTYDGDPGKVNYGIDPHDTVIRQTPEIRTQIANFINQNGKITDPCGTGPCYGAGWTGVP